MRLVHLFSLVILLGTPTVAIAQIFSPEINLTSNLDGPTGIYTADLDGDGDLDLLTSSALDNKISWFENNGSGEFSGPKIVSIEAQSPQSVHSVDLDGDGDMDVLSASGDDKIAWYENDGSGDFSTQQIISTQADLALSVYSADLDGDGDMDVLSASRVDDKIAWYENEGANEFSVQQIISTQADGATVVRAADLDDDGDIDVISASYDDDKIAWYENNGSGIFSGQQIISSQADRANSVESADLDGDGDLDVLSASQLDNKIAWYENDGFGGFSGELIISSQATNASSVYTADLDGDGDIDVISASNGDDKVAWYENYGGGEFSDSQTISNQADAATIVFAADLNLDGEIDVISASFIGNKIAWYESDGANGFSEEIISGEAEGAWSVFAADLDGDTDLDVLSASGSDDKIAWYENNGVGEYSTQKIISTQTDAAISIYAADLDGDGDLDVISAASSDAMIAWHENFGQGEFSDLQVVSTQANQVRSVHAADLDGDGDMDLLSASRADDKIAWYENDGFGGFSDQMVISLEADGAYSVYAADLDNDGDVDVLSASYSDDKIAWYENDGLGEFSGQMVISIQPNESYGASSVYAADLDGDGDMDVLSASLNEAKIAWYENVGSGDFSEEQIISELALGANSVYATDLDGDGDLDVLSASRNDNKIAWYENDGEAVFGTQQIISNQALDARSVYSADLDGDGDMDVLSASGDDDKIAWYKNLSGDGCTDPAACNYSPQAYVDDLSCCYSDCGCTTQGGESYDPLASCDNGSCRFPVLGTVFFDENENGAMDETEYGLPLQQLTFLPDSMTLTTNDNGQFFVFASGSNEYTFSLTANPLFPYNTTPSSLTFDATVDNWNQNIFFGVSNEAPDYDLEANLYSSGAGYPCDVFRSHDICFRNTGNTPIDVIVELEHDTLFQAVEEISPTDSIIDNRIYFSYDSLLPGQMVCLHVELHTPTVEFIGEYLESTVTITGYFEGEQVAFGTDSISEELTCAYDPNDKQVFPAGYTDAHYVPEEEYLEYLVRFQNTGNAPATDVIIRDTLDDGLDISSFELVTNSHSVFTTVDPATREVEFYFQDIQLPDSVNNEPESHGLVSYRIRPEAGLPLLTELNNTAYIFFDNNPPIVTNTTWSTLYDCSLFEVTFTQDGAILTASEGDSYQWYLDGEPIEGATAPIFEAFLNGEYAVQIGNEFPCSELTSSIFVLVDGLEELAGSPITLFPNPMTTSAILDLGELRGEFVLDIFDITGKLLRSETKNQEQRTLNLSRGQLLVGQYLLRLRGEAGSYELPFVVE